MERETKFNIGDNVWFMFNNKIHNANIIKISCVKFISPVDYKSIIETEKYQLENSNWYISKEIFNTKEELINSL